MTVSVSGVEGAGISIDGGPPLRGSLDITTEVIDVSTGLPTRRPDMAWEKVDKKGHFHAFTSEGKLPTLIEEVVRKPCPRGCDDPACEGITVTRYRCRSCRQKIRPAWVLSYDTAPRSIPGRMDWTVAVRDAPVLPPDGEVSVKVTANRSTHFGFGCVGDATVRSEGARVLVDYVIYAASELGRRTTPATPPSGGERSDI